MGNEEGKKVVATDHVSPRIKCLEMYWTEVLTLATWARCDFGAEDAEYEM